MGGLNVGEVAGLAGFVGVADDGYSGKAPGEHVDLGVTDKGAETLGKAIESAETGQHGAADGS